MDENTKKAALRTIPYRLYVPTSADGRGNAAAATVNRVTQASFRSPLVVVGVGLKAMPEGRTDHLMLALQDLGEQVFHGG